MYAEKCTQLNTIPEIVGIYNSIFNNDFNLGFHIPKKDLCTFCEVYQTLSDGERERTGISGLPRPGFRVRNQKQEDKERTLTDTSN